MEMSENTKARGKQTAIYPSCAVSGIVWGFEGLLSGPCTLLHSSQCRGIAKLLTRGNFVLLEKESNVLDVGGLPQGSNRVP